MDGSRRGLLWCVSMRLIHMSLYLPPSLPLPSILISSYYKDISEDGGVLLAVFFSPRHKQYSPLLMNSRFLGRIPRRAAE